MSIIFCKLCIVESMDYVLMNTIENDFMEIDHGNTFERLYESQSSD
jgi:hypothetical protein